jgi:manganese transport protein
MFEIATMVTVFSVSACFVLLVFQANPDWGAVAQGFVPKPKILLDKEALFIAMACVGGIYNFIKAFYIATVMPHNLYLHSHISKFRSLVDRSPSSPERGRQSHSPRFVDTIEFEDEALVAPDELTPLYPKRFSKRDLELIWKSIVYSNIDSVFALSVAFCINSSILVLAGSLFFGDSVADLFDAHHLIKEILGPLAGFVFAIALLLSGQSSTITGTNSL